MLQALDEIAHYMEQAKPCTCISAAISLIRANTQSVGATVLRLIGPKQMVVNVSSCRRDTGSRGHSTTEQLSVWSAFVLSGSHTSADVSHATARHNKLYDLATEIRQHIGTSVRGYSVRRFPRYLRQPHFRCRRSRGGTPLASLCRTLQSI